MAYSYTRENYATTGYISTDEHVKIEAINEEHVEFIDNSNKRHKVKLYKDNNRFIYFKFKSGIYYIRIFSAAGMNFSRVAYRRNGDKLTNALGSDTALPFDANIMKIKNFEQA